jgi:hypothetical protein
VVKCPIGKDVTCEAEEKESKEATCFGVVGGELQGATAQFIATSFQ